MKNCIIKIGEGYSDVQTNGISTLEILDALSMITKQLSINLVQEAIKHVGNDKEKIARWIDLQRQNNKNLN